MIRLTGAVQTYRSPEFTHSVHSGTSSTLYVINHNLGKIPDVVKLFFASSESSGGSTLRADLNIDIGQSYFGYDLTESSENSFDVRVYRLSSISRQCYFKAFILGGDHI